MSLDTDRVRRHTAAAVLRRIDDEMEASLRAHADAPANIATRLAELEREWDIDRVIETEAAGMGLLGIALGVSVKREFLALPLAVGGALFLYAMTGRYPLLPVFRRLGFRTAREIARERYALKALRGDFLDMEHSSAPAAVGAETGSPPTAVASARGLGLVGSDSRS